MSLWDLVHHECDGANPLMRLGTYLIFDLIYKDDGNAGAPSHIIGPAHFASMANGAHRVGFVHRQQRSVNAQRDNEIVVGTPSTVFIRNC